MNRVISSLTVCKDCGVPKPPGEFYFIGERQRKVCKDCQKTRDKKYNRKGRAARRHHPKPVAPSIAGTRVCRECRVESVIESFPEYVSSKNGKKYRRHYCVNCARDTYRSRDAVRGRRVRVFNPEQQKDRRLMKQYAVSLLEFREMLASQQWKCSICQMEFEAERDACVDHSHSTGAVRGLLCNFCNTGIGLFRENAVFLASAIEYIKKHCSTEHE